MVGRIKLFHSLEAYFKWMRIDLPQSKSNPASAFKPINLPFLLIFVQLFVSSCTFFALEAKSAYDYGFSFYICAAQLQAFTVYVLIVCSKSADIAALIQSYEDFVEMRQLFSEKYSKLSETAAAAECPIDMEEQPTAALYNELNAKVEQMTKTLHFVLLKLSLAGFCLPMLASTLCNYFLFDLGDESYILPCPTM